MYQIIVNFYESRKKIEKYSFNTETLKISVRQHYLKPKNLRPVFIIFILK